METDTFANNRLSLILHSENPVRHLVNLHVEGAVKGAAVLYETLKDPKTAYSEDPEDAPVMYAYNKEGITGTYFDRMRQEVRECSIHVRWIHLISCSRTLEERCFVWYLHSSRFQQCI